ncbi:hypothetical protein [Streptomyces violaceusniger]
MRARVGNQGDFRRATLLTAERAGGPSAATPESELQQLEQLPLIVWGLPT